MLVQDFLQDAAACRPEKTALVSAGRRLTYAEIDGLANRLANALIQVGVTRGDRVAVFLPNSVEAVVAIFGVLKAGAMFMVINRTTKPAKLAHLLKHCRAAAMVTDPRGLGEDGGKSLLAGIPTLRSFIVTGDEGKPGCLAFAAIAADAPSYRPPQRNIDLDIACLIATSGSTGEPKSVMCDHSNVVFATQSIVEYLRNTPSDVVLNVLPLSFTYGLYQLLAMFAVGGTLVLEESFAFPVRILQRIQEERVTGFAGVPTIFAILLGMDLNETDLSSLRYLTNAASALPVAHVRRLRQTFPRVDLYLMHGLTEVARTMYLPPDQVDIRPTSTGLPIPSTELWIEDEAGRRLGPGEVGELVVRGRHVMRGYWEDAEKTAERFRPGPLPGERVCYTGDLFQTDEDGYYHFVGRQDDIIKSRGEKVAPREVEAVLLSLRGVTEAVVVGVPDPILGQAIKAVVVRGDPGIDASVVLAHCRANLEDFMIPRIVEFRDNLPKSPWGKLRRGELV
jgi:long-chain acyl-CoA synthetase